MAFKRAVELKIEKKHEKWKGDVVFGIDVNAGRNKKFNSVEKAR